MSTNKGIKPNELNKRGGLLQSFCEWGCFPIIVVLIAFMFVYLYALEVSNVHNSDLKENLTDCEVQLDYRVAGLKYMRTNYQTCVYVLNYLSDKYNLQNKTSAWDNETMLDFLAGYEESIVKWDSLSYERLKDVPDLRES